jgi:hypothetical protein
VSFTLDYINNWGLVIGDELEEPDDLHEKVFYLLFSDFFSFFSFFFFFFFSFLFSFRTHNTRGKNNLSLGAFPVTSFEIKVGPRSTKTAPKRPRVSAIMNPRPFFRQNSLIWRACWEDKGKKRGQRGDREGGREETQGGDTGRRHREGTQAQGGGERRTGPSNEMYCWSK